MARFKLFIYQIILIALFQSTSTRADQLIIEPEMGREPILAAILHAKSTINLVMYGFTDPEIMLALASAKNVGKHVNILLEPHPFNAENENLQAMQFFNEANIHLRLPNPNFKLTHQKTFLFDYRTAMVMTFNLTSSSFNNERNFALIIEDPEMIREITDVFVADWQHKNTITDNANLIWSPNNSRQKILDLIHHAQSEIKIYTQELSDYKIIGALIKAARNGAKVQILMSIPDGMKKDQPLFDYLTHSGILMRFSHVYSIHAKVMVIDKQRAMLGSINFTRPSLNLNRELSVITHDRHVIDQLLDTFDSDWRDTKLSKYEKPFFKNYTV